MSNCLSGFMGLHTGGSVTGKGSSGAPELADCRERLGNVEATVLAEPQARDRFAPGLLRDPAHRQRRDASQLLRVDQAIATCVGRRRGGLSEQRACPLSGSVELLLRQSLGITLVDTERLRLSEPFVAVIEERRITAIASPRAGVDL